MSIRKKSLISTLKAAKKANVASDKETKGSKVSPTVTGTKGIAPVNHNFFKR
jgi:hypothetical protein